LNLLPLFGCTRNSQGDYIFVKANTPQEITLRETATNEFRQFYDELKKVKSGSVHVVEYFLNVSCFEINQINILIILVDFSIQIMVLLLCNLSDQLMDVNSKYEFYSFEIFHKDSVHCYVLFIVLYE